MMQTVPTEAGRSSRPPPNKALQLASHSVFQSIHGTVFASRLGAPSDPRRGLIQALGSGNDLPMLRLKSDLLRRLCLAAVVAGAAICSLSTPIAAGPVWSGPGDFCRSFSEAIFDDSSYFVAIPS